MSRTATLYDILHSELHRQGFNELENNGKFTFHDDKFSFMKKIMKYDEDVQNIVNDIIFHGETLNDEVADTHFKKTFVNHFLDKSINSQTVDMFSSKVLSTFLMHNDFINHAYDSHSFITGESSSINQSETETTGKTNNNNENRNARSELPQTEVNVDMESTVLDYANEFNFTKTKDNSENESLNKSENKTVNKNYSMENLVKVKDLLKTVFIEFEKNCFLQVF